MDLSSLNVDVLLYLLKFVDPVDRFNLAVSGILKGFENAHEGINPDERIDCFRIELGLRRGGTCELEIRSLFIKRGADKERRLPDERVFNILERLTEKGYLQNTRHLRDFGAYLLDNSSFVPVICSMENLEKLELDYDLTLEDLALVFQSCSKLIELYIVAFECYMDEDIENQLRLGFQRLRRLHLGWNIFDYPWPVMQEMLTWLKECVNLKIFSSADEEEILRYSVIDGSLTLDPKLAEGLQILNFEEVPAALAKWILSVCLNIHTLKVESPKQWNNLHNEMGRLKKLKKLDVEADDSSELKEIVRSCRQVEILVMEVDCLALRDLAELEHFENMTDFTLTWRSSPSIEEVLQMLKRWRQLRRLTLQNYLNISVPQFEGLVNFIMKMKHLSYLHIIPPGGYDYVLKKYDDTHYGLMEILRDKVHEFILPRRANFKFDISRG